MSQLLNTAKRHSIVAAYEFDEASGNLLDKIGSNNGTASGTPVYGATDQLGGTEAIEFDGSTDYFTLGSNVLNGASAYTVELLAKVESATDRIWFDERDAGSDGVRIYTSSGTLYVNHNASSITAIGSITTSQWHHVHVVWDGSDVFIYVDGSQVGTGSIATALSTTAAAVIGARSFSGANNWFDGDISHVAIYPRALTATEVGELYDVGTPKWAEIRSAVRPAVRKAVRDLTYI